MPIGIGIGIPLSLGKKKVIQTVLSDAFNRADDATTMGNADTGQAWSVSSAAWGIINNQAYCTSSTATQAASIDAGISDFDMSVDILFAGNDGVVFRYSDGNNHLIARFVSTGLGIYKFTGGATTQIGTTYAGTFVGGNTYNLRIVCVGDNIKAFVDGVLALSVTDTFNQTATKVGFRVSTSTGKYDNLVVTSV